MKKYAYLLLLSLLLSACGGGGGGGTPPQTAPTPPVVSNGKIINQLNYLQATWVGAIGTARVELTTDLIPVLFDLAVAHQDLAGTYPCSISGTMSLGYVSGIRTFTPSNCKQAIGTSTATLISGSVSIPIVPNLVLNQRTYLGSTTIALNQLSMDWGVGAEEFTGSIVLTREPSSAGGIYKGNLSVLRNGRADQYTNVSVGTFVKTAGSPEVTSNLTTEIVTPRFTSKLMAVVAISAYTGFGSGVIVVAPDYSSVDAELGPAVDQFTYYLYEPFNNNPIVKLAIASSDPSVVAAINNALS
jgi:hypothetical protein